MADQSKIHRADAQFKKVQRAEDGKKAMSEYEAEGVALRAKTERLRAQRLAREAEDRAAAEAAPAKPERARSAAKSVKPAAAKPAAKSKRVTEPA